MNNTKDLAARFELPDIRQVGIYITYYFSTPVPGTLTERLVHKDRLPELPALPDFLREYAKENDCIIQGVEIQAVGRDGGIETIPFKYP